LELDEELLEAVAVAEGIADVTEADILDDGKELVGINEVEKMEVEVGMTEEETTALELEGRAAEDVVGCVVVVGEGEAVVVSCCCVVVVV
jgi:hypothetical protein